jgi:hypothetical protein
MLKAYFSPNIVIIGNAGCLYADNTALKKVRRQRGKNPSNTSDNQCRISKVLVNLMGLWEWAKILILFIMAIATNFILNAAAMLIVFTRSVFGLPVISKKQEHSRRVKLSVDAIPSKPISRIGGCGNKQDTDYRGYPFHNSIISGNAGIANA